ncbi:MAG: aldo/keto reductase [Verrucomicrobiae bacterium]|nr:aldo/keto reductase [Verrucomicrobiae bacterium]
MSQLNWGILGTGMIARRMAQAMMKSRTGRLVAVGSRSLETARKFSADFAGVRGYGSSEELVADPDVQAVYISLPNHLHGEWTVRCARAGKHVLCEKPFTLNHAEAMAVVEAVRAAGVFLMEAFMYRCHPQTARLVELVRGGAIGEPRLIQAAFCYHTENVAGNVRFVNAWGGGAIMDVGCYCMSMARLLAGSEPVRIKGVGHIDEATRVDDWASAVVQFPTGLLAELTCAMRVALGSYVRVWGSEGHLVVSNPWFPGTKPDQAQIQLHRVGREPVILSIPADTDLYAIEVDIVAEQLANRQARPPAMTWDDTIGNMRALDLWRREIGLEFESESLTAKIPAIATGDRPVMKYGRVDGVAKPVSRLVCGTMLEGATWRVPHAMRLFDAYFERGGNTFDTAYVYQSEPFLGKWIRDRGVRDQVVVIAKGGATTLVTPQMLDVELQETLDRFGFEHVDIYLMHRDNLQVPVGEFVDWFNRQQRAGRIGAFGGSNWTLERVAAANDYARQHGLTGMTAISNQFSLARMVSPVWDGCISVSDAASRAWLTQHQLANFAWSSQARGFFSGGAHPENRCDAELVRCWYSDDNFERLARVQQLAARRGVLPINIAAAYVLAQPFPSFALIGPRTMRELITSFDALPIELTPAECAWLNLERDTPEA